MYENENSSRVNEETTLTNDESQEGVHMDSETLDNTMTNQTNDGSQNGETQMSNNGVNAEQNETTNQNGASQEGVHMDSVNEDNAVVTSKTSGKSSRSPYNGSTAHGVAVKAIQTIQEYDNSMKRLKLRFGFLVEEYQEIKRQYGEKAGDVSARSMLLKMKSLKESQMDSVKKVKVELEGSQEAITAREEENQGNATFETPEF